MKKLITLIGILCFPFLNAQFVFNIGKNQYFESKVYLEDGTVKEGYLLDFGDKRVVNFQPQLIAESFASSETRFGLADKAFYFRKSEKGDEEKIELKDILKIERKEFKPRSDEFQIVTYEKLKVIMYDNNLQKDMDVPEFLAPVKFKNGKISVFSFVESQCQSDSYSSCKISALHYYFKPADKTEGIKPTNFTFGNFFTIAKLSDKYYLSFKLLGEDCPKFLEYVEQQESLNKAGFQAKFVKLVKNIYGKKLTDTYKAEYKAKKKKAKKQMKKEDFKRYEAELYQEYINDSSTMFYEELFEEMIVQYINSCE